MEWARTKNNGAETNSPRGLKPELGSFFRIVFSRRSRSKGRRGSLSSFFFSPSDHSLPTCGLGLDQNKRLLQVRHSPHTHAKRTSAP